MAPSPPRWEGSGTRTLWTHPWTPMCTSRGAQPSGATARLADTANYTKGQEHRGLRRSARCCHRLWWAPVLAGWGGSGHRRGTGALRQPHMAGFLQSQDRADRAGLMGEDGERAGCGCWRSRKGLSGQRC